MDNLIQKNTELLKKANTEQLELILIFVDHYLRKCKTQEKN